MIAPRRFPRTSAEAFKGCDYACAVIRHRPRMHRTDKLIVQACLVASLLAALFLLLTHR